jgi:hypothetical protein
VGYSLPAVFITCCVEGVTDEVDNFLVIHIWDLCGAHCGMVEVSQCYYERGKPTCCVNTLENQEDNSSSMSMELQEVLNAYSTQKGGVGFQVTVIFSDGKLGMEWPATRILIINVL